MQIVDAFVSVCPYLYIVEYGQNEQEDVSIWEEYKVYSMYDIDIDRDDETKKTLNEKAKKRKS